jgi:ADP-ribose pyrophosphatase YjhB (NUDIX family)
MQNLNCSNGCCNYFVIPYKNSYVNEIFPKESNIKIRKAGSFIFDASTNKMLLVQSRGHMWGPPKGSMKFGEEPLDCALREIKEETGLELCENCFCGSTIIKTKALYYFTNMKEQPLYPQEHVKDNDANGIGWFNVDCLDSLIKENRMLINQHCRILIKKVFNKDIIFNEQDAKYKRLLTPDKI